MHCQIDDGGIPKGTHVLGIDIEGVGKELGGIFESAFYGVDNAEIVVCIGAAESVSMALSRQCIA